MLPRAVAFTLAAAMLVAAGAAPDKKPRDVLDIPTLCNGMSEKTDHPTQKPEELIRRLVRASSVKGDLVVDPFVGSGTTLVVAEALGRRWAGADNDPRYVGLTRARLRVGC